jgi:cytochrome c oxidase, subunit II
MNKLKSLVAFYPEGRWRLPLRPVAFLTIAWPGPAFADAKIFPLGLPPAASEGMATLSALNAGLWGIAAFAGILAAVLLAVAVWRFRARIHPVPSQNQYHTLLQFTLTAVPALVLGIVTLIFFKVIGDEAAMPKADVTVVAIGRQWYWTYAFPKDGAFQYDSNRLSDSAAKQRGKPRLLAVDNPLIVPVNKVVEVVVTSSDAVHGWSVPALGVMTEAIPGHYNRVWFKPTQTGTYYGQCAGQCGAGQAFMPVAVKVVSVKDYKAWLEAAKTRYANDEAPRLALP